MSLFDWSLCGILLSIKMNKSIDRLIIAYPIFLIFSFQNLNTGCSFQCVKNLKSLICFLEPNKSKPTVEVKPNANKPPAEAEPSSLSITEDIDEEIDDFLNSSISASEDLTKEETVSEEASLKADYVENMWLNPCLKVYWKETEFNDT